MNFTETEKFIKSGLNRIGQSIYQEVGRVEQVKYCQIGYGQRARTLESTEDWEQFDCLGTWGGPDSHFCFAADIVIPEEAEGEEVVVRLETGATDIWNTDNPQFIAYADGKMLCAMDMNHQEAVLTRCAEKGERIDFRLYAYSNSAGKSNFLTLRLYTIHKKIEKIYYDLKVPYEAAELMREDDDLKTALYQKLLAAIACVDFRNVGRQEYLRSLEEAEKIAEKEILGQVRESSSEVYSVGHTHIDVAWKWPVRQTREKALRSFRTVLALMEEYPEYIFMSSQPQLYQFVKEECPELYEKIKEKVKEGRWETEGGMWLEADCNVTSGESLVRQIVYGKKFFRDEFGRGDNVVLWLPDVFGYSAALPQIMKKTGMKYFMTTKIGWNEKNRFPYDTMIWEGIDGSEVLAHFITTRNYRSYPELNRSNDISTTYNGLENASQVMGTWQRYQNKSISKKVLTCYGYGDGGGGTTRQMVEQGKRLAQGVPGCPVVKFAKVRDFFTDLEEELKGKEVPKWCGELYLEFHRGTYTSLAENKKSNRECEYLLQDTEWLAVCAKELCGMKYPQQELEAAWKLLLLNQFHDILPGTSIEEVYEQTGKEYREIREICGRIQTDAAEAIGRLAGMETAEAEEADLLLVGNSLSFDRDCVVTLPGTGWKTKDGEILQETAEGNLLCRVPKVPAKGMKLVSLQKSENSAQEYALGSVPDSVQDGAKDSAQIDQACAEKGAVSPRDEVRISTPYYDVVICPDGKITYLYDRIHEREVFEKGRPGNCLKIYDDRPYEYDAWNIDEQYRVKCWEPSARTKAGLTEEGPYRWVIKIENEYLHSVISQNIILYGDCPRIDFETRIEWNEHQQLLKTEFPFDIMSRKAVCDIQYGNVERATHKNTSWEQARFEMCMHKWIDISEEGYGAALLNDCKYGYSAEDACISLTLLKSGIFPNANADIGVHEFTYSLYTHNGDFREGLVIQEAYKLNCRPYLFWGRQKDTVSFHPVQFRIAEENIFSDVMKLSEDRTGIVIRLYEAYGRRTRIHWKCSLFREHEVWECNMLEERERQMEVKDGCIETVFRPYEIKTFEIIPSAAGNVLVHKGDLK